MGKDFLTIEELREVVNHVFREADKPSIERVAKLQRYCSTANALITYSTPFIDVCGGENCDNCKEFHTLLKQEAENKIAATKNL